MAPCTKNTLINIYLLLINCKNCSIISLLDTESEAVHINKDEDFPQAIIKTTAEIGIQTDYYIDDVQDTPTFLFCYQNGSTNEASTQAHISIGHSDNVSGNRVIFTPSKPVTKNTAVGPDCDLRLGFLGFEDIKEDLVMKQLTGITLPFFLILSKFIEPGKFSQPKYFKTLNRENRLLLLLMKMNLGLTFAALSCLFKVSKTTASNIFFCTLDNLLFYTKTWIFWPSRGAVKENLPKAFRNYPNCRAIIDCSELRCDTPPNVEQRILMYSSYKSTFTVKFLIAISPCGTITFISKCYGGRATDGFIVNDSGFINLIEPGDEIIADKGFPQIRTQLLKRQCSLIMPPFGFDPQFTREEVMEGYSIASVRIHVERAIQRIKIFKILEHINIDLLPYIDKILFLTCILANNKEPLIRKDLNTKLHSSTN